MKKVDKVSTFRILGFFWQYARNYKGYILLIILGVLMSNIANLFLPWQMKKLIDIMSLGIATDSVTPILIVIFATWIISDLGWRIGGYVVSKFQPKVMADLETGAFEHLLGHSEKFFSDNFTGALVRKITRLHRSFEAIADELQFSFIPIVLTIFGALIGFYIAKPILAIFFLVWIIVFMLFNFFGTKWKLKYDIARNEIDSKATGVLSDTLSNMSSIKSFTSEESEKKTVRKIMEDWRKIFTKGWLVSEGFFAIETAINLATRIVFYWYAIRAWQRGILTIGDFVLIEGYILTVFMKTWDIARSMRRFYEGISDAKEMVDIIDTPYDVKDAMGAKNIKVEQGMITFDHAVFNYNETREVINKLDLNINAQQKIALVGPSGAGKSTITKLLFRFYDLTSGKITIDGQDISKVTQESLRRNISFVPQDTGLFHRTITENIAYGKKGATQKEIVEAAKQAQIHDFIMDLPEGYDTYVGERGVKLSGGERQRVAIARAILKNAPILILDEATSSLDSESEKLIQVALFNLMKNKTTIVIAHRLSTIMQMDKIVVIDKGRVIDQGTHQELLSHKGIYKKLWDIQVGGFIQ